MKYVDASALLRILFQEPGPAVPLQPGDRIVSSRIVAVETFRAVDRERLLGHLDDAETAVKRKELGIMLGMLDLLPVDEAVLERAQASFAVNLRTIDAIHVASAEVLIAETGREALEFWTHDERQAIAARSRGLDVAGIE
ncbi:MAG TPA: type II toxin-antitoxin system VapC family toxin [Vicinamibacterales bacterium]